MTQLEEMYTRLRAVLTIDEENELKEINNTLDNLKLRKEELTSKVIERIESLEDFENIKLGHVSVAYIPPSTIAKVDTDKMKEDGIYTDYVKMGTRKASVRITIKDEK